MKTADIITKVTSRQELIENLDMTEIATISQENFALNNKTRESFDKKIERKKLELYVNAKKLDEKLNQHPESFSKELVALAWHNFHKRQYNNTYVRHATETLVQKRMQRGEEVDPETTRFSDEEEGCIILELLLKEVDAAADEKLKQAQGSRQTELLYGSLTKEERENKLAVCWREARDYVAAFAHPEKAAGLSENHLTKDRVLPITNEGMTFAALEMRQRFLHEEVKEMIKEIKAHLRSKEGGVSAWYHLNFNRNLEELAYIEDAMEVESHKFSAKTAAALKIFEKKNILLGEVVRLEKVLSKLRLIKRLVDKGKYKDEKGSRGEPPMSPPAFQG